jgi:hypothetical protein
MRCSRELRSSRGGDHAGGGDWQSDPLRLDRGGARGALGFISVPSRLAVTIVVIVLAYLACAELTKRWGDRTTGTRTGKNPA